ncbi:MAG: fumarylacetoacetase [Acidimicrobiia bacterium]|nr:fumarylacetoacetase [Acidimicrobiia bacterium]
MNADPTTDPLLHSWVDGSESSGFPIQNLPYGVFRRTGDRPRVGVAIGNSVLDLSELDGAGLLDDLDLSPETYLVDSLQPLLEAGRSAWTALRARLSDLLEASNREIREQPGLAERALTPISQVELIVPVRPGDYVDFYSSLQHATNLGRLFRPDGDPLLPNWRHIPIGYHGRSSSVVVSGTPIHRPHGQLKTPDDPPHWGPTERLDIELEVGFITGAANQLGEAVPIDSAEDHIFGIVLVNDWSARDVQAWEYQPLGPFLGKSFATSIGPWVVTLDALAPFRVPAPIQDPPVLEYLQETRRLGIDLQLEVELATSTAGGTIISRVNFSEMYWTMAQQLAHVTSNGTPVQAGDLYASGTVSGAGDASFGSLIELTRNGAEPIALPSGERRTFLEDGDTVTLRGSCGGGDRPGISLGEVTGTVG